VIVTPQLITLSLNIRGDTAPEATWRVRVNLVIKKKVPVHGKIGTSKLLIIPKKKKIGSVNG
jgi:hypothetical protein